MIVGSLCFLTQFMSSHSPQFLLAISWILKLKKLYFVLLTVHLKYFQFSIFLVCLKLSRSLWQFASYHTLECLVILTFFECLYQILSVQLTKDWMISPSSSLFWILHVLSPLMDLINSMMKLSFFAVFNQSMLFGLNVFFKNWNVDYEWGMIRSETLV